MEVAAADSEWAVGFEDECWWSRLALPTLSSWTEEGKPLRLLQRSVAKDDPEPKAVSCYGLYLPEFKETWLRFVDGQPVSGITSRFLGWCTEKLEAIGKKFLLLIWDNASWHISRKVRRWIGRHNREVKKGGTGVRIVSCLLPIKSPWLNAIEPKWVLTASGRWSSPTACLALTRLPTGSVESSDVRITSIYPFPRRSPDRALGRTTLTCTPGVAGFRYIRSSTRNLRPVFSFDQLRDS
jgi:hypothetical protein